MLYHSLQATGTNPMKNIKLINSPCQTDTGDWKYKQMVRNTRNAYIKAKWWKSSLDIIEYKSSLIQAGYWISSYGNRKCSFAVPSNNNYFCNTGNQI